MNSFKNLCLGRWILFGALLVSVCAHGESWEGVYLYEKSPMWTSPSGQAEIESVQNLGRAYSRNRYLLEDKANLFLLEFLRQGESISGKTIERNSFGVPGKEFLYATILGKIDGDKIKFIKTYDAQSGVKHSVNYEGQITPDGRSCAGKWQIFKNGVLTLDGTLWMQNSGRVAEIL